MLQVVSYNEVAMWRRWRWLGLLLILVALLLPTAPVYADSSSGVTVTATGYVVDDTTPPAAVTLYAVPGAPSDSLTLVWLAPADDGNVSASGNASTYDIRYSTTGEINTSATWNAAFNCTGEPTPATPGDIEIFEVTGLSPDTTYYFALKTADEVPNWSDLSNSPNATTSPPAPTPGGGGGGGGGAPRWYLDVNMWGEVSSWDRTRGGMLLESVYATSADARVLVHIAEGTEVLGPDGQALDEIIITPVDPPPTPPEGYYIIAAFTFEPSGTTFEPAPGIGITIAYDPAELPEGVDEASLVIAFLREDTGEWEFLVGVPFSTTHFTVFALLAAALAPTPTPTPTATPTPTPAPAPGLGTCAWTGIGVGILFVLLLALILLLIRRRRKERQKELTISSTDGGSLSEPAEGTYTYNASEVVNLVAVPDAGYEFINWTGDVDTIADVNASSTTITMNANYSITANFARIQHDLSDNAPISATAKPPQEFTGSTGDAAAPTTPSPPTPSWRRRKRPSRKPSPSPPSP